MVNLLPPPPRADVGRVRVVLHRRSYCERRAAPSVVGGDVRLFKGPVLKRAAVRVSTRSRSRAAVKCLQLLQFLVIVEADRMISVIDRLDDHAVAAWRRRGGPLAHPGVACGVARSFDDAAVTVAWIAAIARGLEAEPRL
jgi:hypothetical protein